MNKELIKKTKAHAFGKDVYLLGVDKNGVYRWLEEASWDCDWYWGFGYIESYTNNKYPSRAKDINVHTHFDSLFFNQQDVNGVKMDGHKAFNDFFEKTTLNDVEIWRLVELMQSFYIAREYSDMLHRGGSYYTENPCAETIKNDYEYRRINKEVIPTITSEIYKLLSE